MNTQTVLITGASSGIGKALARQFAAEGFAIVAVASNEAKLSLAAVELRADHAVDIVEIAKDLTQSSAPQEIYDELRRRGITIDILVNDAGIGQGGTFGTSPIDKDIEIIRLNVESLTRLTKLFLNDMLLRDSGRILNVGSVAGFQPGPLLAVYHATKAYVNSFSEALAEELKDTNVSVTLLCPGPTNTDFFERADLDDSRIFESGMLMEPEEVAEIAYDALMDGERVVIPGMSNRVMTFTRRLMPLAMQAKLNKKFYEVKEERQ
ncbi:MAG TPA: SDR family oxidoreductase [Pseudomonadales bacterium]